MSQAQSQCDEGAIRGLNTTLVLHPLTAEENRFKGITNAQMPGFTTESIAYDPFDKPIAGKLLGSSSYNDMQFTCYMLDDNEAQYEMEVMAKNKVQFSDLFYYYDDTKGNFYALDLASDPCGTFGISGFSPQAYGRNDLVRVQFTLLVNGPTARYKYHTDADSYDGYDVVAGVLTLDNPASDFSFVTQGFTAGMSVIVETGDNTNPYFYAILSAVTATTLTFTDTTLAGADLTGQIHAARVS
jgi:hypothetical protein